MTLSLPPTRAAPLRSALGVPPFCIPASDARDTSRNQVGVLHRTLVPNTTDAWVHTPVSSGLTFQFEERPPLSRVPIELVSSHPHIPNAILGLLGKEAMERVHDVSSPGCLQPHLSYSKEKRLMETRHRVESAQQLSRWKLRLLRKSIRPMHLGVFHINYRKYMRSLIAAMHFNSGLCRWVGHSPSSFHKLMAAVGALLRLRGALLLQYCDNWLLHQLNREVLLTNLQFA